MERKILLPEWEGSSFQKWAKNYCYKNHWRVAHILGDYEDCLAECALYYVICRERYGASVNSEKQFMFMYNLWVTAEFDTKSTKDYNNRQFQQSLSQTEASIESDANLAVKLADASDELKSVLNIFLNAPNEIMEVLRQEASSCHPKQFFKSVLKMAGIQTNRSADLAKELEELLSSK